jgi:acyl dehydratase
MTALLGTLPFIATLWLLVVLGAAVLEESGGKIAAALKGDAVKQPSPAPAGRSVRVRMSSRREAVPLRAAA